MKYFRKIMICIVCWMAILGFSIYETYSIFRKEYERQSEIAVEAHKKIGFSLDMIKIAVMTEDTEAYNKSLADIQEQVDIISPLGLIKENEAEYLRILGEYIELLESKAILLNEMKLVKTNTTVMKDTIAENYGNKDALTRDKLKQVKDTIASLKLMTNDYTEEKILTVVDKVNWLMDDITDKASSLVSCIDTCYKNRISEINDELAEKMKAFAEVADSLNSVLENEFDFEMMKQFSSDKNSG